MEKKITEKPKSNISDFVNKTGSFGIPNVLFENLVKLDIKPYEFMILSVFYFAHQNRMAYPTLSLIEKLTGISKGGIRKAFKSLIAKGYIIKKQRILNRDGNMTNIYSFEPFNNILEGIVLGNKNNKVKEEEKCQKKEIIG